MSSEDKRKIFTPANLISFVRVGVGMAFFYALFHRDKISGIVLLTLFVLLDILDGYIARRFNCTSDLGVVLDHGTDKFFAVGTLIILFLHGVIPSFIFYAFIFRDVAMSLGWILVRVRRNLLMSSRFYGKLAGGFYFLLLFIYLLDFKRPLYPIMFITLILYYISALYYARAALKHRRESNNEE